MNDFSNTGNSGGILKNFYGRKKTGAPPGPIAQMNQNSPMMAALRQKRDTIAKTAVLQNPMANKIMHKPGANPIPTGGLKKKPVKHG